jgi:hypothetical protein
VTDADPVAFVQIGPRQGRESGADDSPDGLDFVLRDLDEGARPAAHDPDHARGGDQREPAVDVQAAEDVSGKKDEVNILHPIRPPATLPIERKIGLIAPDG